MRVTIGILLFGILLFSEPALCRIAFKSVSNINLATKINTLPVPKIASDKSAYCEGDIATLTESVPANAGYTINWYLNGTLLTADQNLVSIQTNQAGIYTVIISDGTLADAQTSQQFQFQYNPTPTLGEFPAEARICTKGILQVVENGSVNYNYLYRWYTNGVLNGGTERQFTVTQSGQYRVEVSACGVTWVSSNTIQVDIVNLPTPILTADKTNYCTGDNATLSLSVPADPSYTINWYRDNTLIATDKNLTSVTTNIAGSYTATIVNNAQNYDGTYCTETASAQVISFNALPTISIEKSAATSLCDGQTLNLSANYTGGTVKWSTGQTTDQIAVNSTGTYTATVTSNSGCQATASVDITFLPAPALNLSNASVCPYQKQPVTLVAPSGYAGYSWNGLPGGNTFQVSSAQTVSLVVTDASGCTASQQIEISDSCPNLLIPNVFTPNNDGINETWVIEGVPENPDLHVMVFDRYGAKLYDNTGYATPWNGEYRGKKVPAGVFYYLITVPSKNKTYSGPLTILY